ncbi:MAG: SRPBCC family protein [Actinomycetota bacterium]
MTRRVSMWGEHGPRPRPLGQNDELFSQLCLTASVDVDRPQSAAWDLLTDIARIGEFSPECIGARWIEGDGPVVGARFEGTNRKVNGDDEFVWIRPCTVTVAEQPRIFTYVVGDRYDGSPASEWEFVIEPTTPDSCCIMQTFRHVPDGWTGVRTAADADPANARAHIRARMEEMQAGMHATLDAIKGALEA